MVARKCRIAACRLYCRFLDPHRGPLQRGPMDVKRLAVLCFAIGACGPPNYPGEKIGEFALVGALIENTCGHSALPAVDPLQFSAELRADGPNAYWRSTSDRRPIVNGIIDDEGGVRFSTRTSILVWPRDVQAGIAGCSFNQEESIVGTVVLPPDVDAGEGDGGLGDGGNLDAGDSDGGAGPMPPRFTGTNRITFSPTAGSDCSAALSAAGGPFLAIPCELSYALAAN